MLGALAKQLRRKLVLKVHGSGSRVVGMNGMELKDQPICPEWIDEGEPRARAGEAVRSADGRITAGEWTCTAGRFRWTYYHDEVIRILDGEIFLEIDGEFRRFGPGDSIFFPMGQTVRWHVPRFVHKFFFEARPGQVVEVLRTFSLKRQSPRRFLGGVTAALSRFLGPTRFPSPASSPGTTSEAP